MVIAIALVGGFAILFSLPTPIVSWLEATDTGGGLVYWLAASATLGWLLSITLFVLAFATQSIVAISVVGGLALLGGFVGVFLSWVNADKVNEGFVAVIVTFSWLLNIALFALALVK